MDTIFNRKEQKQFRQKLRKNMPKPEQLLWLHLKRSGLGVKFRRQHGIGPYIADFYCPAGKLVIELDGDTHFTAQGQAYDQMRDVDMERLGLRVLRFTNIQIRESIEGV